MRQINGNATQRQKPHSVIQHSNCWTLML